MVTTLLRAAGNLSRLSMRPKCRPTVLTSFFKSEVGAFTSQMDAQTERRHRMTTAGPFVNSQLKMNLAF